jgi:uncharacterized protein
VKTLKEKSIAVVGVSANKDKYGYKIFKSLLFGGYQVTGVNPKGESVLGKEIFKSLREIQEKPDLVICVVRPEITEHVVEECKELGINEIWLQPGSESQKAIDLGKDYGMEVTHSACIMLENGIW